MTAQSALTVMRTWLLSCGGGEFDALPLCLGDRSNVLIDRTEQIGEFGLGPVVGHVEFFCGSSDLER
ncbi:hypothetical protein [Nocardia pseudovaccinii]|uniref:hypothetical protein n=1 Tax=Nocardia pseudovaccinii TaxID=189540 RepID=UPI0012F500B7|nr:hypothetical protein [Nocardia pseudovaccinii]